MELTSSRATKDIFAQHGLKPRYGLGQNFLIDQNVIKKLLTASNIQPEDTVLEIGPGIGTLTQELAKHAKNVIAIEKDPKMVKILEKTLAEFKNVKIIQGDVLKLDYQLTPKKYKLVANLPYYITAPVLRKFLELCEAKPSTMTVIVQKEVAQRICAKPPKMSILAVAIQVYASPKIVSSIKKTSFWPQPKVDSAILHIIPFLRPYPLNFPRFFTVVKAGFKQPRKQIVNNLSRELHLLRKQAEQWLQKNKIQPTQRAETLTIQDWINLTKSLQ